MAAAAVEIVVVGCGAVSSLYYAPALQLLEQAGEARVVGLVDPNAENARALGRAFQGAICCAELSGALSLKPRLAIVASPPPCHAAQTIQLLGAGVAVLCEKPMATSVAEGRAMLKAAAAGPALLAVGLSRRFFPATQLIRDALHNRIIGEAVSFSFQEGGDFRWPVMSGDYFSRAAARGGVLLDLGVHALDLMIWWWGQPDRITCEDDAMGGVEANCRIQALFASGLAGEIRLSRDWPLSNRYRIQGTRGWLEWEVNEADRIELGVNGSCFALNAQLQEAPDDAGALRPAANFHRSFLGQLRDVIAAVGSGRRPRIGAEEGLQSLILLERCQRERKLMETPWLSADERRRALGLGKG
jgi:predicted dehydrogenase